MEDADVERILGGHGPLGQGRRQLVRDEVDSSTVGEPCDLAEALLYLFAWRTLTAPEVQWLAECAVRLVESGGHADIDFFVQDRS